MQHRYIPGKEHFRGLTFNGAASEYKLFTRKILLSVASISPARGHTSRLKHLSIGELRSEKGWLSVLKVLDEHFRSSTSAWTSCISWHDVGRCKDLPCLRKRASADFGANYAAALALDLFVEREGIVTPSEARTAPGRLEQRLPLPTLESLEHLGPTKQFCTSLCPWLPSAF